MTGPRKPKKALKPAKALKAAKPTSAVKVLKAVKAANTDVDVVPTKSKEIEPTKRGSALARAIEERASALGMHQKTVAQKLGFSEPYYALLLSGQRWFGSVAEDKLKRIADFLDIPLLSVYMLAEVIYSQDFYRASSIEDQIQFVLSTLSADRRFAAVIPPARDWKNVPLSIRLLVSILYQDVSGKDLMERFKLLQIKDPQPVPFADDAH